MEGKGRGFGDKGSSIWKLWWFCGTKTAFSTASEMFRDRHELNEARNIREIRSLNRFSMREREREREGCTGGKRGGGGCIFEEQGGGICRGDMYKIINEKIESISSKCVSKNYFTKC